MSGLYELSKEYLQLMEMAEEGELNQDELEEALLSLDGLKSRKLLLVIILYTDIQRILVSFE